MSVGQITAKDRKYAELRKQGLDHTKAWRQVYKTKPPSPGEVPEHVRALVGAESDDEFDTAHEVASNNELKVFWTDVMRDKNNPLAMRISAASELAKAKGIFAAASKKKPVDPTPKMTEEEIKKKIKELSAELYE